MGLFSKKEKAAIPSGDGYAQKLDVLLRAVTEDSRWDINDEALFVTFGMELYGYAFGLGTAVFFMDENEVDKSVIAILTGLGGGTKYVEGLVEHAHSTFLQKDEGLYSQMVDIGWQHFADENLRELVESVFANKKYAEQ